MLKNKFILYLCTSIILVTAIGVAFMSFKENPSSGNTISENIEKPVIANIQSTQVDALYIDMKSTIKELAQQSDLIIEGTVIDTYEYTGISTMSTVSIANTIKGNSSREIKILQLNGDSVLEKQMTYILILGKQSDLENTYYVKGGTQGVFLEKGNILALSDEEMKKDFEKIKNLKSINKNLKDDKKLLLNYLKEIQ